MSDAARRLPRGSRSPGPVQVSSARRICTFPGRTQYLPGTLVPVEVTGTLSAPVGKLPTVGEKL